MLNVLFLMAGKSEGFQEAGYSFPKNLVEIDGQPLVQRVVSAIASIDGPQTSVTCLIPRQENRRFHTGRVLELVRPGTSIVEVNAQTGGAACTAMLAISHIERDAPLLIVNGDIILEYPLERVLADFSARNLDGGVTSFHDVHPRWSFVKLGADDLATQFAEKDPISNIATTGFSWFARGADFLAAASEMFHKDAQVDGQFFIAPAYNELILKGKRIGCHTVPKQAYHSLKTPQDVRAYEERLLSLRRQCA